MRWKIAFLLVLAIALGFIAYTLIGPGGSGKQAHLQSELDRILEENRALEEKNRRLALEVEALKHRKDYQEKVARDELGLVRKSELVFHLPEESYPPSENPAGDRSAQPTPRSRDAGTLKASRHP